MGSTSNFHNDERTFHYEPTRAYLTHRASVSSMQPVEEKPPAEEDNTTQGLGISDESKISSVEEFNSVYPQSGPPSRTQSQLQVRDLQDQMKGLHIKISTLKVKAQEDGLRRRSLQSLRIPSPLASSKNWYENEIAYKGVRNMNKVDEPLVDGSETPTLEEAVGETQLAADPKNADVASVVTDIDDDRSVVESLYEDAEEGQYAERETDEPLNETLEAFPSVPNSHGATPHEDREDAFDYEHFILHSALGNYAQTMRRSSVGSTGSVETTRPVHDHPKLSRSNSVTSQSTMASFATATEGERNDDLESVLYWDQRFNDGTS